MNHKRKRPKSRRAGCLLCKSHKRNGCEHKGELREKERVSKRDLAEDLWTREEQLHS